MSAKQSKKAGQTALLADDIRSNNYSTDQASSSINNDREPKDKKGLIFWVSMLLGCGILVSYNFLISAPDYFDQYYPDYNVMSLIVPAYTIPDVIFLILSLLYGHLLSFTSRICFSFLLMGVILFFPILTQYIISDQDINFYIILAVAGFTGLTTAILQTSIIGFCNYLPLDYIRVSIAGQSVAGILAGVIRIIINLIEDYTSMSGLTNGMIYFGIGGLFDILCCILFLYAIRNAFVRFHLTEYFWTRKYRGNIDKNISQDLLQRTDTTQLLRKVQDANLPTPRREDFEAVSALSKSNQIIKSEKQNVICKKKMRKRTEKEKKLAKSLEKQQNTYLKFRKHTHNDSDSDHDSNMTTDDDDDDITTVEITKSHTNPHSIIVSENNDNSYMNDDNSQHKNISNKLIMPKLNENNNIIYNELNEENDMDKEQDKVTCCGVFYKIKLLVLSVFLVFYVTFVVFPAMVVSIDSQYKWVQDNNWMAVFLVLEFNICDYIGRQFFAAYTSCSFSKRTVWFGCAWRVLIIPLFVMLNIKNGSKYVIQNDVIAYLSTGVLGITNGHFCCLCFMWVPTMVNSNEQQICGSIMSFALVMGITLGSYTTLTLIASGVI